MEDPNPFQSSAGHSVRLALLLASLSRYTVTLISLLATFVIARTLSPAEFGLFVLGSAIFPIAEAVRDLGLVAYIVQHKDITREKIRTAFTLSLAVTILMALVIFALAGPVATFFAAPMLKSYILVLSFGYLLGPVMHPLYALMSRDLAYGRIAVIETVSALVYAGVSVLLVRAGWNILGIALASALATVIGMILYFVLKPAFWIYRPSLRHWREMLGFGLNGSAAALLARSGEAANYLIIGTLLGPHATGILQRAAVIAFWPERIVLAGLGAIALSALSKLARQDQSLVPSYLRAISIASAVNWAALVCVALLAEPLVAVLLGHSWEEVVPLVHILAMAAVFTFPNGLNAAAQTAAGGIAQAPLVTFVQNSLALAAVVIGARFGTFGIAWCALAATPFIALVGTVFVRRRVFFSWGQLWRALLPSALLAGFTALFTAPVVAFCGTISPAVVCVAGSIASGLGLFVGVLLVPHPLREELSRVVKAISWRVRSTSPAT